MFKWVGTYGFGEFWHCFAPDHTQVGAVSKNCSADIYTAIPSDARYAEIFDSLDVAKAHVEKHAAGLFPAPRAVRTLLM